MALDVVVQSPFLTNQNGAKGFFMNDEHVLKPGEETRIVVDLDETLEYVDARASRVYDVEGDRVTIAQTDPPLDGNDVDLRVLLTKVLRGGEIEEKRYGSEGRITEIIDDYKLTAGESVCAVVVKVTGKPEECNLRMHFRIKPSLESGVRFFIEGIRVGLYDISLGGVRLIVPEKLVVPPGTLVNGCLQIDGDDYRCKLMVLRSGNHALSSRRYMALRFHSMRQATEDRLFRKIREMERQIRQKEMELNVRTGT